MTSISTAWPLMGKRIRYQPFAPSFKHDGTLLYEEFTKQEFYAEGPRKVA
jgi:hypothetical protein